MATGLTTVKKFTYRGDPTEEYSNTYFFTGSTPSDATAWGALLDALVTEEKKLYAAAVSVIRAYAYDDDSEDRVAVWSRDYTISPATPVAGTLNISADFVMPGDTALWVRWRTSRMTTKGKPIYLRKYFHPAYTDNIAVPDTAAANWKTAATAFGAKLRDGTFLDARTLTAPGHSDVLTAHGVSSYVGYRQLRKRAKRPT